MHTISSIFIWPKKTTDREILHRLYVIGLARIQEIQIKLLDIISADANILRSVLLSLFVLNPERLSAAYEGLCEYKINREGETVLDSLWHLSSPLIPIVIGARLSSSTYLPEEREQILKDSEDWRELVKRRRWKEREMAQTRRRQPGGGIRYRSTMQYPRL